MRAGKLNQRITIQQIEPNESSSGGLDETWIPFATVWGNVKGITGGERYAAHQIESVISHEIKIRYLAGVNSTMRILHDGKIYEIKAVFDPESRKRELIILAEEEKANGT